MRKVGFLCLFIVAIGCLLLATQSMQRILPPENSDNLTLLPELMPPPGFYKNDQSIQMQPSHPRGTIIFTLDGSSPSKYNGTLYTQPIFLDAQFPNVTTIRAVEVVGDESSPFITASYAVGISDDLPVVTLTADPYNLWDPQTGLLVNTDRRGTEWERVIEFAMLNRIAQGNTSQSAGLRITGDPLDRQDKFNFRLYFRTEYGNPRLDFNPFQEDSSPYGQNNIYKRLLLQAARKGAEVNIVRDQLVSDILSATEVPVAQGRIVHLVINGDSWGLYRLTERIDNVFLEDNLNINSADIVQEGNAREGSNTDWKLLISWVTSHNMLKDSNLRYIESLVNLENLITTACVQSFFELAPDAYYAVHPENGRWFWIYEGGGIVPFQNSDFSLLTSHLLQNTTFRLHYAKRCGALLNATLSSAVISQLFEDQSQWLRPFFHLEQARWSNTPPWEQISVQQVANLAQREFQVRDDIDRILGHTGIADVNFQSVPPDSGNIYVDGIKKTSSVSAGISEAAYFVSTDLQLHAVSTPGYTFRNWQLENEAAPLQIVAGNPLTITVASASPYTITAHFQEVTEEQQYSAPDAVHFNEYWINDNGTRYASIGYRAIEGDWVELLVEKPRMDLRNWRITDNDTKSGSEEGSIIFPPIDALRSVPRGTIILLITTQTPNNDENFPVDDLAAQDKLLLFYAGNGNLDITTDPGFDINTMNDNLALLSPGSENILADDIVVDFIAEGRTVTAYSFGALEDNVTFDRAFSHLGNDDGAVLSLRGSNNALSDWIVDPDSCLSGDNLCPNTRNIVTPGRTNPLQSWQWAIEKALLP